VVSDWRTALGGAATKLKLVAIACCSLLVAVACGAKGSTSTSAGVPDRPNVLVFLTDDQATSTFRPALMPQTFRWIVDRGTQFTQGLAAPPLCCPDRAGILTGQYPHNHGVFSTAPGYGALQDPGNTLPVWLKNAGYDTALVGKYMNRYQRYAGLATGAGWDRWFQLREPEKYFGFDVNDGGVLLHAGPNDYSTTVLTAAATDFLDGEEGSGNPFFLYLAYHAPHIDRQSTIRGCRHNDAVPPSFQSEHPYLHVKLPRGPAFNEANVTDKPQPVAGLSRMNPFRIRRTEHQWRCALAADGVVDQSVGTIMSQLKAAGELRSTLVFFLSDNGFFYGEHRLTGKSLPYEPSLLVPYAVRLPRDLATGETPKTTSALVSNQDVAPTILDVAGNVAACSTDADCRRMDGRTLVPYLTGAPAPDGHHKVLVELDARAGKYNALRTASSIYTRYLDGGRELYDLRNDPNELHNLVGRPGSGQRVSRLNAKLERLRTCSGIRGRDPRLPGVPFCG
jgi:N-acetylglucosamine-6-sulfatase